MPKHVTRLVFCPMFRLPSACLSLRFDHLITNLHHTFFITDGNIQRVRDILTYNQVICDDYTFVQYNEINKAYTDLELWKSPEDPRHNWLYEQGFKLAALDLLGSGITLLHDPATWITKPYRCEFADRLQILYVPNKIDQGLNGLTDHLLGINDYLDFSWISDLYVTTRDNWVDLRDFFTSRHPGSWLKNLLINTPTHHYDGLKWFSAGHFLNAWAYNQYDVDLIPIQKQELHNISDLETVQPDYYALTDASPPQSPMLQFTHFRRGEINNIQQARQILNLPSTGVDSLKYYLCWFDSFPVEKIRRELTLDECIDLANAGDSWSRMYMMRVNWMVRDLQRYPMYKPIVVDENWFTIVGDTRLMACELLGIDHVMVLAQQRAPIGRLLHNIYELFDILKMDQAKSILWTPQDCDLSTTAMTWFDISDSTASQHIVTDESADVMIRAYMQQHSHGNRFQFSRDWFFEPIDWLSLSNLEDQSSLSLRKIV